MNQFKSFVSIIVGYILIALCVISTLAGVVFLVGCTQYTPSKSIDLKGYTYVTVVYSKNIGDTYTNSGYILTLNVGDFEKDLLKGKIKLLQDEDSYTLLDANTILSIKVEDFQNRKVSE